ncbi:MAG: exosome complex protein Rrp42 [archaeon]|nr:exosome complex protein Rrp42 [archaeon]
MTILYQNKQYIRENIVKSRLDQRKQDEYRPVNIDIGCIEKAEGSARVRIGETDVIVGIKMDIGTPYPDSPDEGTLMVNAELSALASPEFENGPPREKAIELSRVVDRGIRESKAIDVKKLCIEKNEKIWMVFIDISIVNHDGNLIDAAGIAAISALMTARIPKINEDGTINRDNEYSGDLPLNDIPVPISVGIINNSLVTDMTKVEEDVSDSITIITTNNAENFCAMQKSGPNGLTEQQMLKIAQISKKEGKKIRALIKNEIKKYQKK